MLLSYSWIQANDDWKEKKMAKLDAKKFLQSVAGGGVAFACKRAIPIRIETGSDFST